MGKVPNIKDLTLELGCKVGGLSSCYLSLLLGAPPSNLWRFGMLLKRDFEEG